jgi:hypothetical protein
VDSLGLRAVSSAVNSFIIVIVERYGDTKMMGKLKDWAWRITYTLWAILVIGGIVWGLYLLVRNIITEMLK